MENQILKAINEMESCNFSKFDELLDYYSIDEIIDMYLQYNGYGHCAKTIKYLYETFYILIPKTI